MLLEAIKAELDRAGYVHLRGPFDLEMYRTLAGQLGHIVGEESIALRPGAHAYVAKPGRVPLHTDHAEVDLIGWRAEEQDAADGASLLLDTWPVVEDLSHDDRCLLQHVRLMCPALTGGPPTLRFPVLRKTLRGWAVFCSPWLRSADDDVAHQRALDSFRDLLHARAKAACVDIRLQRGEVLFVDNQRVLHGRRAIGEASRRRLQRIWILCGSTPNREGCST